MATLHGNWLPDLQRFWIWGETWQKVKAAALPDLSDEALPSPAKQPYQLDQAALSAVFQTASDQAEELDLSWMCAQVMGTGSKKVSAKATKSTASKTTATRKSKQKAENWQSRLVVLPTEFAEDQLLPMLSANALAGLAQEASTVAALYPWQISGSLLDPLVTIRLLSALPLGHSEANAFVGDDLRYWSHLVRWCLDLLARGKFVPVVSADNKGAIASWQLLLDSALDQSRLKDFCDRIPLICRSYLAPPRQQKISKKSHLSGLICRSQPNLSFVIFLATLVDAQVRSLAQSNELSAATPLSKDLPLREWLDALGAPDPHFESTPTGVVRLNDAINTWTAPLQNLADTVEGYRTCFALTPPPAGEMNWALQYGLQAIDDDGFRVDAETLWQHPTDSFIYQDREIEAPQETLLGGLGRAARLYEPIKPTLTGQSPTQCGLDPIEAYQFFKSLCLATARQRFWCYLA